MVYHFEDEANYTNFVADCCKDLGVDHKPIAGYVDPREIIREISGLLGRVLVITDEHLAREAMMNGGTIASAIKGAYPGIPVIIYTGDPGKAERDAVQIKSRANTRRKEVGILEVVAKGDDPEKLIALIKSSIESLHSAP